jgi:hypothetical protein
MAAIFLSLITLCQVALAAWSVRLLARRRNAGAALLATIVTAMAFGAIVLSTGRWLGEGALLAGLSRARFLLEATLLPLLVIVAFEMVRRADLERARHRAVSLAVQAIAIALAAIGLKPLVSPPSIAPVVFGGILYYRQAGDAGLRLPVMIAWALVVTFGLILFRRINWPWLALGAIAMFLGDIAPTSLTGPIARSIAQTVFAFCLLLTESAPRAVLIQQR